MCVDYPLVCIIIIHVHVYLYTSVYMVTMCVYNILVYMCVCYPSLSIISVCILPESRESPLIVFHHEYVCLHC